MKLSLQNVLFFLPVILIIIGVFILYEKVGSKYNSTTKPNGYFASNLVSKPLPELNEKPLFEKDKQVISGNLKGNYFLLNVFASWCFTCLEEHKLFKAFERPANLKLIGIDWRDTETDAKNWLAKHGNPYDQIAFDDKGKYGISLGIRGVPETVLVSPEGIILMHIRGNITEDFLAEVTKQLK